MRKISIFLLALALVVLFSIVGLATEKEEVVTQLLWSLPLHNILTRHNKLTSSMD